MVKNFMTICLLVLGINTVALAADTQQETNPSLTTQQVQQQVIDEYKVIVAKIPPEVRDEIIAFRKNIVAINKQKRDAYQKLSQEAQSYLAKEQEYKKKLPIKQKPLINIQNPGEKPNKDSSTAK